MPDSQLLTQLDALSRGGLRRDVPLAPFTSFGIGGPAQYLALIHSMDDLVAALTLLHHAQTPFLLLGGGTNILISDAGVPGLTIINRCKKATWPERSQQKEQNIVLVDVDAGAPLAGFARESIHRGFVSLSWAVSIPGSVGGAIVGNAGAHGHDIASVLVRVQVWHEGRVETWPAERLAFTYRNSSLKGAAGVPPPPVILSATFRLATDVEGVADEQAQAYLQHRRRTQPTEKSAGSIFKNPPGDYAGRLIEEAGLKGRCIGEACISEKHANFIVNRGRASAADVVALINLARSEVWRRFHILLEPEILFIGDWSQGPWLIDPRET